MATIKFLTFLILTLFSCFCCPSASLVAKSTYDVQSFGAKSDGKSDSKKAFLSAWGAACATTAPATIYVPSGRYLLSNAVFSGDSCKNKAITLRIDGTLVAPSDYNAENWLKFERVTGVSVIGGTLEGQGTKVWDCKKSGKNCPQGATSLGFYNSENIVINGLTSLNSQMFHILIHGCQNAKLNGTKISAPDDSLNTDGIHVSQSSGVTIMNSHVGTGDDCVSIGPGTSNLWIQNLECGPGHGVSIGSLGWEFREPGVQNVTLSNATFIGTENGVRIKTWSRPCSGFVKDVLFQHIVVDNVENPIIIDQNYCPANKDCPNQGSGVKISDVTYEDIQGTSAIEVAIKLNCSKIKPCSGIRMNGVKLSYKNKPAAVACANAITDGGKTTSGANLAAACRNSKIYFTKGNFFY